MKVAVAYGPDGDVFPGFGRAPQMKIYEIEDGQVVGTQVLDTPGHGHTMHVNAAVESGASVVICNGIGGPAAAGVKAAGLELYAGVSGNADEAVQLFAEGKLVYLDQATHGGGCSR